MATAGREGSIEMLGGTAAKASLLDDSDDAQVGSVYVKYEDESEHKDALETFPPLFFMPSPSMLFGVVLLLVLSCLCLFTWNDSLRDWPSAWVPTLRRL